MTPDVPSQRIALRSATEQDASVPAIGDDAVQLTVELDGKALVSGDAESSHAIARELALQLARFRHAVQVVVLCAGVPARGTTVVRWAIPGAAWLRYVGTFGGPSLRAARTARTLIVPFQPPLPLDADDEQIDFELSNEGDTEVVAELVLLVDSAYAGR